MKNKSFSRLLALSAALLLTISVQGTLAFAQEDNALPVTYEETVDLHETQTQTGEIESTPSTEPEATPTPAPTPEVTPEPEPTPSPSPTASPTATPSPTPSSPSSSESSQEPSSSVPTPTKRPDTSSSQGGTVWEPDSSSSQADTIPNSGPNFSDEDNSELIDDGAVINSLPLDGELSSQDENSGSSETSSESSSQESSASTSGNSGSSILLILGISLIVLGVAGLGTVAYIQFIHPRIQNRNENNEIFEDENGDGYEVSLKTDDKADTAEIDINNYDADAQDEKK